MDTNVISGSGTDLKFQRNRVAGAIANQETNSVVRSADTIGATEVPVRHTVFKNDLTTGQWSAESGSTCRLPCCSALSAVGCPVRIPLEVGRVANVEHSTLRGHARSGPVVECSREVGDRSGSEVEGAVQKCAIGITKLPIEEVIRYEHTSDDQSV